jgi:hypothetical protein
MFVERSVAQKGEKSRWRGSDIWGLVKLDIVK